jgi:FkbM family methyltransferase
METFPTTWFPVCIHGLTFDVLDYAGSESVGFIERDMNMDAYGLQRVYLDPGDIVVDIGANVGLVSVFVALTHPDVRIIAVEARRDNYEHLVATLARNQVSNVTAVCAAVAGCARLVRICGGTKNSGGGSIYPGWCGQWADTEPISNMCQAITLEQLFARFQIEHCKLMKVDIEGSEYEVFANTDVVKQIDFLSLEVHPPPLAYTWLGQQGLIDTLAAGLRIPEHLLTVYA